MGIHTAVFPLRSCYLWGAVYEEGADFHDIKPFQSSKSSPISREWNSTRALPPTSPPKATVSVIPTYGRAILIALMASFCETQRFLVPKLMQKAVFASLLHQGTSRVRNTFLFWGHGGGGGADSVYVGVNEEGKKWWCFVSSLIKP